MTLVNIDLRNQGYETGPDDRVIFYSLLVREGDFGTISTAPVEVRLTDGKATIDLAPGPVGVQIIAGQIVDTRVKIGEVPPSGPTTLGAVMMVTPAYTPALQKMMIAAVERAEELALDKIDSEVALAVDEEVGEFKTKAEQALTKSAAAESKSNAALSKSTTAESSAGNAVSRVSALEAMSGLSPESPADGQTANLVAQESTLTRAAVESAAAKVVHQTLPEYLIGPTGEYATVMDFFADHPTGNARIVLQEGVHQVDQLPSDGTLVNFQMVGMGRTAYTTHKFPEVGTTVQTTGPLLDITGLGSTNLYFADFNLRNVTNENTDNGIKIEYPIMCKVERLNIYGYGGSSIWFEGGTSSEINENHIVSKDFSGKNGFAAIHLSYRNTYASAISTTLTQHNYVTTAKQNGYYFDGVMQGCISIGDVAEWCEQAFYFRRASPTLISPYTEGNTAAFLSFNGNPLILGNTRNELIQEWTSAVLTKDRRAARLGENFVDIGAGLLMGLPNGGSYGDFDTTMSIKAGANTPNGNARGATGSLYFQLNPRFGKSLWQKQDDSDFTGWLPIGHFTVEIADLRSQTSWINSYKYQGMMVWCNELSTHVYASGVEPTAPWLRVGTDEQMVPTPPPASE